MAAAHRSRQKAQPPRRKKQQSRGRKKVNRKLLPKRRKPCGKKGKQGQKVKQGQKATGMCAGPRWTGLKRPYDEFISKVLRRLHRDRIPISTKAKGKIISFIRRFYNNVSEKAQSSKRVRQSCTIGSKELQNALKRVMRKKPAMDLVETVRKVSRRH